MGTPLPYDMGNAGDLVKHGLVAEFCEWWLESHDGLFSFVDPFAGRPFVSPPHPEVSRRLQQLADCALKRAQQDPEHFYYGSGNVIKHCALALQRYAMIKVSDRDVLALQELLQTGFELFNARQFDRQDSFSIFNTSVAANSVSLLLIDPFDDFLPDYAEKVVPSLLKFVENGRVPVALFVLCEDWDNALGCMWRELKAVYLAPTFLNLSLTVNKIPSSQVRGESRFHSEMLLLLPEAYRANNLQNLVSRLRDFSASLSKVLGQAIQFRYHCPV